MGRHVVFLEMALLERARFLHWPGLVAAHPEAGTAWRTAVSRAGNSEVFTVLQVVPAPVRRSSYQRCAPVYNGRIAPASACAAVIGAVVPGGRSTGGRVKGEQSHQET
jgi:hypothetical protein